MNPCPVQEYLRYRRGKAKRRAAEQKEVFEDISGQLKKCPATRGELQEVDMDDMLQVGEVTAKREFAFTSRRLLHRLDAIDEAKRNGASFCLAADGTFSICRESAPQLSDTEEGGDYVLLVCGAVILRQDNNRRIRRSLVPLMFYFCEGENVSSCQALFRATQWAIQKTMGLTLHPDIVRGDNSASFREGARAIFGDEFRCVSTDIFR